MGYASYFEDILQQALERLSKFRSDVDQWSTTDSASIKDAERRLDKIKIEVDQTITKVESILAYVASPEFSAFKEIEGLRHELVSAIDKQAKAQRTIDQLVRDQSKLLSARERDKEISALKAQLHEAKTEIEALRQRLAKCYEIEFDGAMTGVKRRGPGR